MTFLHTFFPEFYNTTSFDSMEYNLVKSEENELTLELNVAGFSESEIDIELVSNSLKISATKTPDERKYLHKGISSTSFMRRFTLREDMEVKTATVKNGLLSIVLECKVPEHKKPKKILLTH